MPWRMYTIPHSPIESWEYIHLCCLSLYDVVSLLRRECNMDPDVLIISLCACQIYTHRRENRGNIVILQKRTMIVCIRRVLHMNSLFQKCIFLTVCSMHLMWTCVFALCLCFSSKHDPSLKGQAGTAPVWLCSTSNINTLLSSSHSSWWTTLQMKPFEIYLLTALLCWFLTLKNSSTKKIVA